MMMMMMVVAVAEVLSAACLSNISVDFLQINQ